jgi:hypothetical protein
MSYLTRFFFLILFETDFNESVNLQAFNDFFQRLQ